MIYICTFMYKEAVSFIKQLNLKKDFTHMKFDIFRSEEAMLVISGIGKVRAAIAVAYLLGKNEPGKFDLLANIGICGAGNPGIAVGKVFYCNKIIDNDTKMTFYPDMLFKHPFDEASIETFSKLVSRPDEESLEGYLADMEASGVFQAASVFLRPHQLVFIKVVSDHLDVGKTDGTGSKRDGYKCGKVDNGIDKGIGKDTVKGDIDNNKNTSIDINESGIDIDVCEHYIDKDNINDDSTADFNKIDVEKIIGSSAGQITCWLKETAEKMAEIRSKQPYGGQAVLSPEEQEIASRLAENLKLSRTMQIQFMQMLRYCKLRCGSIGHIIDIYAGIKCSSKREGKVYFAELKKKLGLV